LEERVALEAWECWVIYRSDFWLCGGKALVSQGVEEVLLQGMDFGQYVKEDVKVLLVPLQLNANQELMPTRGIRLFN